MGATIKAAFARLLLDTTLSKTALLSAVKAQRCVVSTARTYRRSEVIVLQALIGEPANLRHCHSEHQGIVSSLHVFEAQVLKLPAPGTPTRCGSLEEACLIYCAHHHDSRHFQ